MIEPDTYFLSSKEALRVAKQQNRSDDQDHEFLQVCYYNGEKIDSNLANLVHLPINSLVDDLAQGEFRLPTKIDFNGLDILQEEVDVISENLTKAINEAQLFRQKLNNIYVDRLKNAKLDFNEPLRFYLFAHSCTTVMQHISKNIADTLIEMGYEVFFHLYEGHEEYNNYKKIFEFNPHVTININFIRNSFLSDDVFNFVWVQDPMPYLSDDSKITLRKRDYIFSLVNLIDDLLEKKGVEFQRQSFCVNEKIYKLNPSIKREKKIVFIGSSYLDFIPEDNDQVNEAVKFMISFFHAGGEFTDEKIDKISNTFRLDKHYLSARIIPFIIRDISLIDLCQIKSKYKIEIYGSGWDKYEVLRPYYKGVLNYGEEIAEVYNSATFAFAPHQNYILQQRTLEAAACGAIPIVYDCRKLSKEKSYSEAVVFFKTFEDIEKVLLKKSPKKDFKRLLQENSYKGFIQKLLNIINDGQPNG
ncbi:hypothetical protein Suden_0183 [Sulfurimonas denitrificans DSM 1251]|uniref:Spore protein YkvP/CgeB glycosyl transferase-like domain-containing protein n=1 Tax=Sulfurimonas denitrificans (strain ATCC 33889 / DSM 1251) TaxID=326298 RepID=Q30U67_SULDN|nr:hypothetical protein [Sulfurimonas denitrificans]ABB43464.1 hypothetical protein Suden_0183 [Sulfurimonas denitrificans DSM 1251]